MARRRMFSETVVGTDDFLDLPLSSQALYFHLGIYGDDDGFVSCPRKVARSIGANMDDLQLLVTRGFLIEFQSGIIAIVDWRRNNSLRNDRYSPSVYAREREQLVVDDTKRYSLVDNSDTNGIPLVSTLEPQHNITEHSVTKQNETEGSRAAAPLTHAPFTPPILQEVTDFVAQEGLPVNSERFYNYYQSIGWKIGCNQMTDWRAACRRWSDKPRETGTAPAPAAPPPENIDWDKERQRMASVYAVLNGKDT